MLSLQSEILWQDREIRFDAPTRDLMLKRGEKVLRSLTGVEDVKGKNGDKGIRVIYKLIWPTGALYITNLRVLWICSSLRRNSLSIGFNCVINIYLRNVTLEVAGKTSAVVILTKFAGTRYEFIFAEADVNNSKILDYITTIYKLYDSTRIYRELRLRGALMRGNTLILLPLENLFDDIDGVWNLSSDQGNLGRLFVTNIRVVWVSIMNDNFNISIPFLHIQMITARDSKFGEALVFQTTRQVGSYLLGFRIDPRDRLVKVLKQLGSLHNLYIKNPVLGIEMMSKKEEITHVIKDENENEDADTEDHYDILSTYLADVSKLKGRKPVYNEDLGLAVESLPEHYTISDLWKITSKGKSGKENETHKNS
ncbi:unnamed protein product [Trichobilharzia szidati]|nr:unnamed protein product [Trichobilharzia szidati]